MLGSGCYTVAAPGGKVIAAETTADHLAEALLPFCTSAGLRRLAAKLPEVEALVRRVEAQDRARRQSEANPAPVGAMGAVEVGYGVGVCDRAG